MAQARTSGSGCFEVLRVRLVFDCATESQAVVPTCMAFSPVRTTRAANAKLGLLLLMELQRTVFQCSAEHINYQVWCCAQASR